MNVSSDILRDLLNTKYIQLRINHVQGFPTETKGGDPNLPAKKGEFNIVILPARTYNEMIKDFLAAIKHSEFVPITPPNCYFDTQFTFTEDGKVLYAISISHTGVECYMNNRFYKVTGKLKQFHDKFINSYTFKVTNW